MKVNQAATVLVITAFQIASGQDGTRRFEPVTAGGGRRLALVVGNDSYASMPLRNARNDARAVRNALTESGFTVDFAEDTTLRELARKVDEFAGKLRSGDVALFFYSGHGMQVEGKNYIIPVGFSAQSESDVEYDAYAASRIQKKMEERGAKLNILVLDACRDNPFRFGRSAGGGLAAMREGAGTLIAFAAAEGQKADDNRSGSNGLFTKYFLEALRQPGLPLRELFFQIQGRVYEASGRKQLPYVYAGLVGDFFFHPAAGGVNLPAVETPAYDSELAAWKAVENSSSPATFEAFLKEFPNGRYSPVARVKLAALHDPARRPEAPASPSSAFNASQPAAAPSPGHGDVAGRVVGQDGKPLSGASVEIFRLGEGRTHRLRTDSNGDFRWGNPTAGIYQVLVQSGGMTFTLHDSLQIVEGQPGNVVLDLSHATASK